MSTVLQGENALGKYVAVILDKTIYCHTTIMKTCYEFTENYYIHISCYNGDKYAVYFYNKVVETAEANLAFPVKRFLAAAHEYELRGIVLSETKTIHEEIIRKAFSPVTEVILHNHRDDPLKINISVI